jgi:hypothetical protein
MVAAVKPMSRVGGRGEPSRIRERTIMKKLLTPAFAIVAALVALVSALTEMAAGYQHAANQRDQYEIAISLNNLAATRQMATTPRPVNYDEPA